MALESDSSAAASMRAFTSRRSQACATPTSAACGVPTRRMPRRRRMLAREQEVGDARRISLHRARWSPIPPSMRSGSAGPNQARIENVEEIVEQSRDGAELKGIACEKPLARNVAEAKKVARLAASVGLNTGYLENQLFAPEITRGKELIWARGAALTGRPYLARAAEEHSGPHMPWFWQGTLQGGGVLNDMMCHSVEVVRHLLTEPGEPRSSIRRSNHRAHRVAQVDAARVLEAVVSRDGQGRRLRKRPCGGFCARDDRIRSRRRRAADRRSDDILELRRRRTSALGRAARA